MENGSSSGSGARVMDSGDEESPEPMPLPSASVAQRGDPHLGMEFDSADDAWAFYNDYACRVGFSTRISVYQRSRRDGSITARQFVCSREGFRLPRGNGNGGGEGGREGRPRRARAVTRVGCKAMIRVKRQGNGRWLVSKLETAHNHELLSPSLAHSHRSRRLLSESGRSGSSVFRSPRSSIPRNAEFMNQGPLTYDDSGVVNGADGVDEIVEYLKRSQVEEPGFFLAMQVEGDRGKGNVFWADEHSKTAYRCFGDVVMFDMSCKIDQHRLPFACFTGLNHHQQPVLFGSALLEDDSERSLVWVFKMLLLAMSGRSPAAIVVEKDERVQTAIRHVLPEARSCFCKWHILREARDWLSDVFGAHSSFGEELHECINLPETIDEFESSWTTLVARFGLRENAWLQSVYGCRHQWVPAYLQDVFVGEFEPSKECQCRTSLFDGYVNSQTNLHLFIRQFEKALDNRYEQEVKADFETKYGLPILKTSSPMEKQASEIYTSEIFMKFQEELILSVDYTANRIDEEGNSDAFKVAKIAGQRVYKVTFNSSQIKASCSCLMFEHSGILCRHILKIFSIANILTLPSHYILKRWTRNAKHEANAKDEAKAKDEGGDGGKNGPISVEVNAKLQSNGQDVHQSPTWRYNSLCREAIKFAEDGATSIEIYNIAMSALQEAVKKVAVAKEKVGKAKQPAILCNGVGVPSCGRVQQDPPSEPRFIGPDEVRVVSCSNGSSHEVTQETALQCAEQTPPLQEGQLPQPPCNFLLVAPSLSSESESPKLLTTADSLDLDTTNGDLDGNNRPVLVSLSTESVSNEESKHEKTMHPPQEWNVYGPDQINTVPSAVGNATSPGSSETQLMAVPMTLYVPMFGNSSTTCSALMKSSDIALDSPVPPIPVSSSPIGAIRTGPCSVITSPSQVLNRCQPAPHLVALNKAVRANASDKFSSSLRATAIAVGARVASPIAAASIIKAMQSKNAIHIRAEEGSAVVPTSPSDLGSADPKPSVAEKASIDCNLPLLEHSSNNPAEAQKEPMDGSNCRSSSRTRGDEGEEDEFFSFKL